MRRRLLPSLVGLVVLGTLALPASDASAVKMPDTATGSVNCTLVVHLHFAPPLTATGGGRTIRARATVQACSAHSSGVVLKPRARTLLTGVPFEANPGFCGEAASIVGTYFSIVWKGTANGHPTIFTSSLITPTATAVYTDGSGDTALSFTAAAGDTLTNGSFFPVRPAPPAAPVLSELSTRRPASTIAGFCQGKGLKSLSLYGTIAIS